MFIEYSRSVVNKVFKKKKLEASSWFPNQHTPSINRCGGMWKSVWD